MLYTGVERLAAKHTTHFVTVADALTRQYLAAGIGRSGQFTRIFSGFPLGPFVTSRNPESIRGGRARWGLKPEDFVVGKIARLFKLKGHDDLLAAAPALARGCPRMRFVLVGDGPWRGRLEAKVRALGLGTRFVFTGLVSPGEIPDLIGILDAVVHLSRREGLPRALPQALAAGKPVVAYDCDGAGEVCLHNETGFLVPPGDLRQLTDRLLQLATDPALGTRLGARGRRLVQEWFPVERMVDALYSLYLRLAEARLPGSGKLKPGTHAQAWTPNG